MAGSWVHSGWVSLKDTSFDQFSFKGSTHFVKTVTLIKPPPTVILKLLEIQLIGVQKISAESLSCPPAPYREPHPHRRARMGGMAIWKQLSYSAVKN
jgi:hypothetical protein